MAERIFTLEDIKEDLISITQQYVGDDAEETTEARVVLGTVFSIPEIQELMVNLVLAVFERPETALFQAESFKLGMLAQCPSMAKPATCILMELLSDFCGV